MTYPVVSSGGEVNTAANVGVGGVGVYDAKSGAELQFRNINAGTGIAVALDAGNKEVDVSLSHLGIQSLTDPNADRILFWDDSAGAATWLVVSTGLAISGTNLTLSHLGIQSLTDPNADRILFWDDSAGATAWLTLGTGLSITGTTINVGSIDAVTLDGIDSSSFLRSDADDSASGSITFGAAIAIHISSDKILQFDSSGGGSGAQIRLTSSDTLLSINAPLTGVDVKIGCSDGRIEFYPGGSEKARMTNGGHLLVSKTSVDDTVQGLEYDDTDGKTAITATAAAPLTCNRLTDDGVLINFKQASTAEGNINVSGTTVALAGAHLSRWSQLPGLPMLRPAELKRGTVMSVVQEMCEWQVDVWPVLNAGAGQKIIDGTPVFNRSLRNPYPEHRLEGEWFGAVVETQANEQRMRSQVSTVVNDPTVYGVFDRWDDDKENLLDDPWPFDFYLAFVGDFLLRVTGPCLVGDLLVSNGDGTAVVLDPDAPLTARMYAAILGKCSKDFSDIKPGEENPDLVPVQLGIK